MKWADKKELHRYQSPKQMPKKCLTKEKGEINLLPTTVSQYSLLAHDRQQGRVETTQQLSTDKARTPTATPKEAPRPLSSSYLLALFLSQTGSPKTHYVLHDDGQRTSLASSPCPSHPANTAFKARHFPALRSSPDNQRHGINTSIKISLQSATDVSRIKQLDHHTSLGYLRLLVLFVLKQYLLSLEKKEKQKLNYRVQTNTRKMLAISWNLSLNFYLDLHC